MTPRGLRPGRQRYHLYLFIAILLLSIHESISPPTSPPTTLPSRPPNNPSTTPQTLLTLFTTSLTKAYKPLYSNHKTVIHTSLLPLALLTTLLGHQILTPLLFLTTTLLTFPLLHTFLQTPNISRYLPPALLHPPLSTILSLLPSILLSILALKLMPLLLISLGSLLGLVIANILIPSLRTKPYTHYIVLGVGGIIGAITSWCVLTEIIVITTAMGGAAGFVVIVGALGRVDVVGMVWKDEGRWGVVEWGLGVLWLVLGGVGVGVQFWVLGGGWKKFRRKAGERKRRKKREKELEVEEKELLIENAKNVGKG